MTVADFAGPELVNAWAVLTLFVVPVGGGIPAGVLLAKSRGIGRVEMTFLYLISDVILACVFEPVMLLAIAGARRNAFLLRFNAAMKKSVLKTMSLYGERLGPLALVLISFGVDPMTGRGAARVVGHGFFTGWLIAITGDLMYFALLMVSTLFMSSVLGDGTAATLIILAVMTIGPLLFRRLRRDSATTGPVVKRP
jgi:hypothetical protein